MEVVMKRFLGSGLSVTLLVAACALGPAGQAAATDACNRLRLWPVSDHISGSLPGDPSADEVLTMARMNNLADVATKYCMIRGGYPENLTMLAAFSDSIARTSCGVRRDSYQDAWDRPVYYGVNNRAPVITSAGADGVFSTADDVAMPSEGERADGELGSPDDC